MKGLDNEDDDGEDDDEEGDDEDEEPKPRKKASEKARNVLMDWLVANEGKRSRDRCLQFLCIYIRLFLFSFRDDST